MCTKCPGGGTNAQKHQFLTILGGVVTIATADTPELELRVCVEVKCESFETCEKCAQNFWGGHKCAKIAIFDDFGGCGYHSNGRYPQSETVMVWQIQLRNALGM